MCDLTVTVIEQPGTIGKNKAQQLARLIVAMLADPDFRAKVDAVLASEGGTQHERN